MRSLIVLIMALGLRPSPAPKAPRDNVTTAAELASDLELAHHCNAVAMDKREAAPLEGLLNERHAPVLEVVYCDRKEKLKSGRDVRSWAYTHCQLPGHPVDEQPPGAAVCSAPTKSGDSCCEFGGGRLKSVCFDSQSRFKRIEYRCAAK